MISENYKLRLKSLAGINEAKTHKNEYGALMLNVDFKNWKDILSLIDKEDIYNEEPGFSLEKKPHCTVLFGFHASCDVNKIIELTKKNSKDKIEITCKNISYFETEDYDVVKFDVESKDMTKLNKIMTDNFDYTTDYPDYHPHITIGYVKKGSGKKYDQKHKGEIISSNTFIYSPPGDKKVKTTFTL